MRALILAQTWIGEANALVRAIAVRLSCTLPAATQPHGVASTDLAQDPAIGPMQRQRSASLQWSIQANVNLGLCLGDLRDVGHLRIVAHRTWSGVGCAESARR